MGLSADNVRGLLLALSSSFFIGASFIVKKKGLKRAGASGLRAGSGGFSYLVEPLWWAGMIAMIVGEVANFAAYAFAPAILVTPLGALSIIVSSVLAHFVLKERLQTFGILGCLLCVVGSVTIVLHAPQEKEIESVKQVWYLATEPGFIIYTLVVIGLDVFLIFKLAPTYGHTHMFVYIGICSVTGSLTALDVFNTSVVSPVYYVMFTSFTILASMIMFKDWAGQQASQIATTLCGFMTILSGIFILHKTKDMLESVPSSPAILEST
ncbi:probable magnesium transporter NIPA3 isoform X2 [Nymphaea colorata]|uniref:probable magnesium transporter NIPA3 isoform X2 n=1 Tax=Nymphaea colorata TaxID=210225 RepID=UPI00129D4264|nr:probable magnesium transporter NIPA3 isoform X2 [Nymphaea colorata]